MAQFTAKGAKSVLSRERKIKEMSLLLHVYMTSYTEVTNNTQISP